MISQRYITCHARRTLGQSIMPYGQVARAILRFAPPESARRIKPHSEMPRHGSGFTLLEMLLALALCGIIMSGVYGAIHLHVQLRTSSHNRIHCARISSTIINGFSTDVQSIATSPEIIAQPDDQSVQGPRFQTTDIAVSDFSERHLNPDGVVAVTPVYFQGTANYIVMLIGSPNPHFLQRTSTPAVRRGDKSGLARQVAWWFGSSGTIRLPVNIKNERTTYQVTHTDQRHRGLVRAERPVQYHSAGPETRDDNVLFSHFADAAEDVAGTYFRYFGDGEWTDTWNSHELKRLPAAVELTVIFKDDSRPPLICVVNVPNADVFRIQGGDQ